MIINKFSTDSAKNYQKFIEENGSKNFDFWSELVEKGNLTVSHLLLGKEDYVVQKKDFSGSIRNIKKVLDSLEKDWAFLFQTTETEKLMLKGFVIYYPSIGVYNDHEGSEHYFEDAFVKYSLTYNPEADKIRIQNFYLVRTTFNELEIVEKTSPEERLVLHPHIGSCSLDNATENFLLPSHTFCMGEDDAADFTKTLVFRDQEEPEAVEYIIHFVEDFISQEDSEGGPYYNIHDFRNRPDSDRDKYEDLSTITSFDSYLIRRIYPLLKKPEFLEVVSNVLDKAGFNYQGEKVLINYNNFSYYFSEIINCLLELPEDFNRFLIADLDNRITKVSKRDYLEYLELKEETQSEENLEVIENSSKSFYFEKRLFTPKIIRENVEENAVLHINMSNFTFPEKKFKKILIDKLQSYVNKVVQEHDNNAPEVYSKF